MSNTTRTAVGYDELAVLKLLALDGARRGEVKVSCADLADRLDASSQTASRRLQALDDAEYVDRDLVSDGQWVQVTETGERALKAEYEDYRRIFEGAADLALDGTVTGGMGEGRHYINLPGYKRQFEEKLGYEPYPGTLNVSLTADARRERSAMDAVEGVPIDSWEDDERTYGSATCYPATLDADRTHHDEDQLELIAPDRLRDDLGLDDGDEVTVYVEGR